MFAIATYPRSGSLYTSMLLTGNGCPTAHEVARMIRPGSHYRGYIGWRVADRVRKGEKSDPVLHQVRDPWKVIASAWMWPGIQEGFGRIMRDTGYQSRRLAARQRTFAWSDSYQVGDLMQQGWRMAQALEKPMFARYRLIAIAETYLHWTTLCDEVATVRYRVEDAQTGAWPVLCSALGIQQRACVPLGAGIHSVRRWDIGYEDLAALDVSLADEVRARAVEYGYE